MTRNRPGKKLLREVAENVNLYRDETSGIAWVEDGKSGNGYSCHPNIDRTGSVLGMKKLGYWGKRDRTAKSHGFIFNIDRLIMDDNEYTELARKNCYCGGKHG